jgi:hypothetical protein
MSAGCFEKIIKVIAITHMLQGEIIPASSRRIVPLIISLIITSEGSIVTHAFHCPVHGAGSQVRKKVKNVPTRNHFNNIKHIESK